MGNLKVKSEIETCLKVNTKLTSDGQGLARGGGICLGALGEGGGLGA
jgi:hypothetical protein